jgi:hypothetical protein
MLQAEDVFKKAIEVRDGQTKEPKELTTEFKQLQLVVGRWRDFRNPKETEIDFIMDLLRSNEAFPKDLAEAVHWYWPEDTSMDLLLLAVGASQKGNKDEAKVVEAFREIEGNDFKWQKFKTTRNRTALVTALENNRELRNALSKNLEEYPGISHLKRLATEASDILSNQEKDGEFPAKKAVTEVFERYLLNWEKFTVRSPEQEFHLMALLQKYLGFRQAVAKAVGQPNSEAEELAQLAVEMWRAIPVSSLIGKTRAQIIAEEPKKKIPEHLCNEKITSSDANTWENVEKSLAVTFAEDPQTAVDLWKDMDWPYPFSLVLRDELKQIKARWSALSAIRNAGPIPKRAPQPAGGAGSPLSIRWIPSERPDVPDPGQASDASDLAVQMKLFGVAFSGGGIRSATFNLGILQQLSKFGLLSEVDYLSTVSGGGYIGSWLTGWMYKNRTEDTSALHSDLENLLSPKVPDPRADEQKPIRFLREFSNYLTPKLGSFSFDTWTMAAVYSRNLFLNQATLISVLGFFLLLPRFMTFSLTLDFSDWLTGVPAVLLLGIAVYCMAVNIGAAASAAEPNSVPLARAAAGTQSATEPAFHSWARDHVQYSVIAPFLVAMYLGSVSIWRSQEFLESHPKILLGFAFGIACFLSFLLLWRGGFIREYKQRPVGSSVWSLVMGGILVLSAGAMTGLLELDLVIMRALKEQCDAGLWTAVIFSPVMLLAVMVVPATLQVGLMGVDFPDAGREWLSRFRAICTVYSVWWIAFLGAAIFGPWLVWMAAGRIGNWVCGITAGWIITTVGGILAGKSKMTGTDKEGTPKFSWLQFLAKAAPPVFATGLILLIATGEQVLLRHGAGANMNFGSLQDTNWMPLDWHSLFCTRSWFVDQPGWLLLMLAAAGLILAWRVDINEFSMHHFYKNRLVRCYLGASNEKRRPNEFTGFDARDDVRLALLKTIPETRNRDKDFKSEGKKPYLGPYPIINTTLNLSAGKQLAWQERKGASFIMSPCFCGFDVQGWASSTAAKKEPSKVLSRSQSLSPAGYRKTSSFTHQDGPFLGTSFSISGAAANPNQGHNTSPTVAFLMTMFDVRLGWWVGNPRRKNEWRWSSPGLGLYALLKELVGLTDDTYAFVNLSDGGHFDNMGIYELVRRRCSLILLCDAEQDHEFTFEGLGSVIRKCRIDFGARIEIDTSLIRPGMDGKSGAHCAVGKIYYLDGSEGTLVYIKPSLTGDEPEDVTQYHCAHADFPHESTADQWFAESQFESYRALGLHAAEECLKGAGAWSDWKPQQPNVATLIKDLRDYWYADNPNLKNNASRNTATLVKMLDTIRATTDLRELGYQLFPGITAPPTSTGDEREIQEFYFALALLQLVEDIYFDFKLDRDEWLNDPRIGGWKDLFETWKAVPQVALAWASARTTFRKDFQHFWEERIKACQ